MKDCTSPIRLKEEIKKDLQKEKSYAQSIRFEPCSIAKTSM